MNAGRVCLGVIASGIALAFGMGSAHAAPPGEAPQNWITAFLRSVANPGAMPDGVNNPNCVPNGNPVILLNGTLANAYATWAKLAPQLVADGRCAYAFNYGGAPGSPFQQLGDPYESAREIVAFIAEVRARTGAAKVDLVGYSQGGVQMLYVINQLGGAGVVDRAIGIEPRTNGSTSSALEAILSNPAVRAVLDRTAPALAHVPSGSPFVTDTAQGGLTRPSVTYTAIASRTDGLLSVDDMLLPPSPNVSNIVIQDVCPAAGDVSHLDAVYNDDVIDQVRQALGAASPVCR